MSWDLRVLTAPSLDTELCLLVTFDNAKYLINCGEGTQRNFVQKKISLRKLDGIFFTNGSAGCVGGLPGVMMTLADAGGGGNALKVAGPENVPQYLASCRTFVQRESLPLSILDIPTSADQPVFQSPNLSVRAITLRPHSARHRASIGEDANQQEEFGWKDTRRQLKDLSTSQLRWWRRAILKGIFKDPNPGVTPSNVAIPISAPPLEVTDSSATTEKPPSRPPSPGKFQRQQTLSRSYIPQPIPLDGNDYHTNSQPSLMEDVRIAYILQAPQVRGKFDNAKAKQLGVPNGPIRGKLTAGQTIEFDDPQNPGQKKVVKPEDVIGAQQDGGAAIILDVDVGHIESMIAAPALREYQTGGDKHANLIVHRVTLAVIADPRYVEWSEQFPKKTEHIVTVVDRVSDAITYTSSSWNLLRLNMLDDQIFKLPLIEKCEDEKTPLFTGAQKLEPYQIAKLYPPARLNTLSHNPSDPNYPESTDGQKKSRDLVLAQMPKYADALQTLESAEITPAQSSDDYGISVTPFGTGSAIPSKYRNGFGGVLLDAGEGTLGQMRRRFGTRGMSEEIYPNLRIVFISHMHADHHLGLRLVLEDRLRTNPQQTLYIVAPSYILLHLVENGMRIGDQHGKTRFVDIIAYEEWIKNGRPEINGKHSSTQASVEAEPEQMFFQPHYRLRRDLNIKAVKAMEQDLDLTTFLTPEVNHRGKAYGLAMQHKSGWKITYSGDTMPSQSLIAAGRDSTLLIHEATLEDTQVEMALAKAHSTFGQAIDVGSRYPKLPRIQPFDPTSEQTRPVIALAFDLMTLRLRSFHKMETYNDAFQALFQEMAEVEPESDEEEETQGKNENKKGSKPAKGVPKKDIQNTFTQNKQPKQQDSKRQQRRREHQDRVQKEHNTVDGGNNGAIDKPQTVSGGKRSIAEVVAELQPGQECLKRMKSDTEDKLSRDLGNLEP
ncbi:hypothetical protein QFC22_003055 [Naganishia vaughanmartiniae]|uniref:Uncharacterized protein n=1 Tax=Naganishia vaughanmartiniae TaxID=1424756 RepID=A0ACC2X942_9TREE|nr:hypothetical protein QFC22_003055 [Naganishia vaughanmartiniae]